MKTVILLVKVVMYFGLATNLIGFVATDKLQYGIWTVIMLLTLQEFTHELKGTKHD